MKRRILETGAAVLLVTGSVVLVATYFPVLNPTQYELISNATHPTMLRYVVGTAVSIAILAFSWKCNMHAKRIRLEERNNLR
jgi:hypothetical protein